MKQIKKLEISQFLDDDDFINYSLYLIEGESRIQVIITRSLKKLGQSLADILLKK